MNDSPLPAAHFGPISDAKPDWRDNEASAIDPDDDEMSETPTDVIEMLGFDPLDYEDEEIKNDSENEKISNFNSRHAGSNRDEIGRFQKIDDAIAKADALDKRLAGINSKWAEDKHPREEDGKFAPKSEGVSIENQKPASSLNPSRAELIYRELSAKNAPDIEYKEAFSTFSKVSLKKGETWKGRLEKWIERENSYDSELDSAVEKFGKLIIR